MVNFLKNKNWNKPFPEKIAKRISKIATNDLLMWTDQALTGVYQSFSTYGRNQTPENLAELSTGVEALHALVAEMEKRNTAVF
jgi:hypothetical protein